MMVGKSVSIDLKDLTEIQEKVKKGESNSVSEFVRNAIRKELKR
ncbi:MAG: ribbon-helix-helix protein, CopG family [Methanobacterium formicicum]